MQGRWKDIGRGAVEPLVRLSIGLGIGANAITTLGLLLAIVAGYAVGLGHLRLGAGCLILASVCDLLDGQVARQSGRAGAFGAFLDSCLDRIAEGVLFLGLIIHFAPRSSAMALVSGAALIGSFMVSYARARAEGLGYTCQGGLMERPERLILLIVALLAGGRILDGSLIALAVLSTATFLQRLRHMMRAVASQPPTGPGKSGGRP